MNESIEINHSFVDDFYLATSISFQERNIFNGEMRRDDKRVQR